MSHDKDKINQVLTYCLQHADFMWASVIMGIILDCDFRDSAGVARKYLDEQGL